MHVTAKADYAVRAVVELAGSSQDAPARSTTSPRRSRSPCRSWRTSSPSCAPRASSAASGAPRAATGSPAGRGARPRARHPGGRGPARRRARPAPGGDRVHRARRRRCSRSGSRCAPTCAKCSRRSTVADVAEGRLPKDVPRSPRRTRPGSPASGCSLRSEAASSLACAHRPLAAFVSSLALRAAARVGEHPRLRQPYREDLALWSSSSSAVSRVTCAHS